MIHNLFLHYRLFLILLLAILLISFVSAGSYAQYPETGRDNSLLYYSGQLGTRQKIEFNLQITNFTVSGSYFLESNGAFYTFNGRMATDKSGIGIIIFDDTDQYVASIEASLISEENNFAKEIKGKWKSADGRTHLGINLKKVAEFAINDPSLIVPCSNSLAFKN